MKRFRIYSNVIKSKSDSNFQTELNGPIIDNELDEVENNEAIDDDISPELLRLVQEEKRIYVPNQEEIETINLGTDNEVKEVRIGNIYGGEGRTKLISLLQEFWDVFA